jgi:hypothetical protein
MLFHQHCDGWKPNRVQAGSLASLAILMSSALTALNLGECENKREFVHIIMNLMNQMLGVGGGYDDVCNCTAECRLTDQKGHNQTTPSPQLSNCDC